MTSHSMIRNAIHCLSCWMHPTDLHYMQFLFIVAINFICTQYKTVNSNEVQNYTCIYRVYRYRCNWFTNYVHILRIVPHVMATMWCMIFLLSSSILRQPDVFCKNLKEISNATCRYCKPQWHGARHGLCLVSVLAWILYPRYEGIVAMVQYPRAAQTQPSMYIRHTNNISLL